MGELRREELDQAWMDFCDRLEEGLGIEDPDGVERLLEWIAMPENLKSLAARMPVVVTTEPVARVEFE